MIMSKINKAFKERTFYRTRSGNIAYITYINRGVTYPIIALTTSRFFCDKYSLSSYTKSGFYHLKGKPMDEDLILDTAIKIKEKVRFLSGLKNISYVDRQIIFHVLKNFQIN